MAGDQEKPKVKTVGTKASQTDTDVLADGRRVAAAARKHWDEFKQADAGKKIKLLPPEDLATFEKNIELADKAHGGQAKAKISKAAATKAEEDLRVRMYKALDGIRGDVGLAYENDKALGKSFGVGGNFSATSTPKLLAAGGLVLASYEDAAMQKAAQDAGVTQKRIDELVKLRTLLTSADTTQNTTLTDSKGKTVSKRAFFGEIKKTTARFRRVARHVLRDKPVKLADFASTLPRRTPKKRAPKTP